MNRRNIATPLWFFAGWTVGAAVAFLIGVPTFVGGILLAIAGAAFIRVGPGARLWAEGRRVYRPATPTAPSGSLATE